MTTPKPTQQSCSELPAGTFRLTRRDLVRATGAGVSSYLLPVATAARTGELQAPYPVLRVADVEALKVDVPMPFSYPDQSSPAIAVRLRQAGIGGVGPGSAIVAFSLLCTHKGCPVGYRPERKLLICPCHWSSFDPAKAGQMVIGQGSQPLPQILLRITDGAVYAFGVEGLIFGRHTNVL